MQAAIAEEDIAGDEEWSWEHSSSSEACSDEDFEGPDALFTAVKDKNDEVDEDDEEDELSDSLSSSPPSIWSQITEKKRAISGTRTNARCVACWGAGHRAVTCKHPDVEKLLHHCGILEHPDSSMEPLYLEKTPKAKSSAPAPKSVKRALAQEADDFIASDAANLPGHGMVTERLSRRPTGPSAEKKRNVDSSAARPSFQMQAYVSTTVCGECGIDPTHGNASERRMYGNVCKLCGFYICLTCAQIIIHECENQ